MLLQIKRMIAAPIFPGDPDKTRVANQVNAIAFILLAGAILFTFAFAGLAQFSARLLLIAPAYPLLGGILILNRRGKVTLASALLIGGVWLILCIAALVNGGIRAPAFTAQLVVILTAGMLLGARAANVVAGLSGVFGLALLYLESVGWVTPLSESAVAIIWIGNTLFFFAAAGLLYLALGNMRAALARAERELEERERVQAALHESEARLRLISENTADVIWVLDPTAGKFTYVSPAVEKLRGYTPAEVMTQSLAEAVTPESFAQINALLTTRLPEFLARGVGNESVTTQIDQPRKDGTLVHTEVTTTVLLDARGQVEIVGVSRDITARKRAEEALRESETRYRQLFDASPDAMFVMDPTGQILDVNEIAVQRYGYTRAELLQMTARDLAAPDLQDQVPARIRQAIETGAQFDWRQRCKDGRELPVGISARAINLNGQSYILSSVRDITERKRAEEALRASEASLRESQRVAHIGHWSWDTQTNQVVWSDEMKRIFGLDPATFDGDLAQVIARAIHPDDQAKVNAANQVVLTEQKPAPLEYRIVLPDQSVRTIFAVPGDKIVDADGNILKLTGVVQDITERKRAEEALRASEQKYRTITENVPIGIFRSTPTGQLVYANPACARILGYASPAEYIAQVNQTGIAASSYVEPAARERFVAKALRTREWQQFENTYRRKDGSEMIGNLILTTEEQADGIFLIGFVQDITERKRAEDDIRKLNIELEERVIERTAELNARVEQVEQLNRVLANLLEDLQLANRKQEQAAAELIVANDALQAKNRELETFTYSVSHDLKAPLRGIDGYSRLLLDDYADKLDDDGRTFLQTIRRATDQMARLIDDLLAYSRVERRALTTGVIHPQALVDALVIERADDFRRRNVALNIALACAAISTDADGLTLILRNLLDNALKFTRDVSAPQIEIGGRDDANACVLWVRDNGIGFEMKYHDRIFEIFQRLHRAEDYPGTGIGLAIVRKALERIGGRVWAESAPRQGATFYIEIPR